MKKTISVFLSFVMLLSAIACVDFSALAAPSINSNEVSLYYLLDSFKEKISIPKNYSEQFQLKVSNTDSVSYSVLEGESATVDSKGLITVKAKVRYWYNEGEWDFYVPYPIEGKTPIKVDKEYVDGDTIIRVKTSAKTFDVTVHVFDYAYVYADQFMDNYIKDNVTGNMTDADKVKLCAKFAADYEYNGRYSSAVTMIIFGGGDCWASTDAIIKMAKKMGFDAWIRNGNKDWGAGSGHINAMIQVKDGTCYEAEAGYDEPAPRYYSVTERTSLFSYRYFDPIEVYQYDGKYTPENLIVPNSIDGKTVFKIGEKFISLDDDVKKVTLPDSVTAIDDSAFNSCENLESINIPASLKTLGNFVFTKCNKLKNITSKSPDFPASNGFIYNKDKSTVLYAPAVDLINFPATVNTIGEYAFYHNYNIETAVIPNTVVSVEVGAFGNCENLKNVTIQGNSLNKIGEFGFACCYKLTRMTVPESVSEIAENAFYDCNKLSQVTVLNKNCIIGDSKYTFPENAVLYGYSGSTLEAYANKYNRKFVSINNCEHASTVEVITKAPTCSQAGTKDIRCNICDKIVKSNISVPMIAHNEVIDVKAVNATCTTAGKTKGSHCSVCNKVISVSKNVPATGHKYSWKTINNLQIKNCDYCANEIQRLKFIDLQGFEIYDDYVAYTSLFNSFISGTNPYEYTLFSPKTPITRAMFVAILYRMAGNPYENNNPYASNPFSDVNEKAYYYNAACWALDNGITNQLTFKPNDNVTREQTARFLFAYAEANNMLGDEGYKNVNLAKYPDYSSVHDWAKEPLQWANYNNMITGTQQGYINPQGATQRIHATRILYGFGKLCNIGNFS